MTPILAPEPVLAPQAVQHPESSAAAHSPEPRWKVTCLEMLDPPATLTCPDSYEGLWVVFFFQGVAMGHCQLYAEQLPLSAAQLANVAAWACAPALGDRLFPEGFRSAMPALPEPSIQQPQPALDALTGCKRPVDTWWFESRGLTPLSTTHRSDVTLTVAICTRERPADLARCLESLKRLTETPYEIIVVDNAPESGATCEVVQSFPGVRYLCEPERGLSAARNTALASAAGTVVAFVDDDTMVHANWLTHIRRCFDDPQVMVATGLVLPAELETQAQMIFERSFQFFNQGYRRRRFDSDYFAAMKAKCVPSWTLGAGANMAIRRSAFTEGYKFDTRLGPGVYGGCGEDSEYWYRLLQDGWVGLYEPAACVFHFHRRELSALRRLVFQYMKGHVAALLLQFSRSRHPGNLRRLFLQLPAEHAILFLRLIVTGFALDNRIMMRGALGCFAGLGFAFSLLKRPAVEEK